MIIWIFTRFLVFLSSGEGDDEGGDRHQGTGNGEPDRGVGRNEGIARFSLAGLHINHIVLL